LGKLLGKERGNKRTPGDAGEKWVCNPELIIIKHHGGGNTRRVEREKPLRPTNQKRCGMDKKGGKRWVLLGGGKRKTTD